MEDIRDYFHGKLDRKTAEERLTISGQPGAFLLRESDRKPGSYVLSYLGQTGINHFKITHAYGSYFIGGRQFESLYDLIHYYSAVSELLTDERLVYAVPPPEPVNDKERLFISILPYTKLAQSDELSFKKGDIFIFQNDLGDGWLWCKDVKTGQSGMVFSQLLEEVEGDTDPNEVFPWFHAHLSKADAVNKLAQAGPGSFLIRPSDNSPGNYTLFYHVGSTVQRFLIVKNSENKYTMGGKCFESLGQIIELYQQEQIIEGHTLQYPVTTTMSRADQLSQVALSTSMKALRVGEKPQDVYNTVKTSREEALKRQSHEVKGWLSLKKGDMQKKWKNYFFVLKSQDRHLYYYEKPQQSKPKGLIDLSYSFLYKLHESLFEWSQCFLLIEKCLPCFANHLFLRCDDDHREFRRWITNIEKFTSPAQSNRKSVDAFINNGANASNQQQESSQSVQNRGSDTFEVRRTVHLQLLEANSLRVSQPYFVMSFNHDIKVAKTCVKTPSSCSFAEEGFYAFDDLPSDVTSLTISLYQSSKKSSKANSEVAQIAIDLMRFRLDGEQRDIWCELRPLHSSDVSGYLRIKIHFMGDIVMNLSEYEALEDLVCDPSTEVIAMLDQVCHRDHLKLARALSNILRCKKTSTRVLRALIEREAQLESEPSALFRTSSLTTALIESHLRTVCQPAFIQSLRGPIKKLLDDKICCELNPTKIESHNVSQKACENLQNLLDLLDELVANIYNSIEYYPRPVRYLFACLQRIVSYKWPNESLVRTRVVSGFLILRLICPTILNPKQFHLIHETPSENAIRNLALIAKCLQSLANLVETPKSNNSLAQSILSTLDDYAMYPLNQSEPTYQIETYHYTTQSSAIMEFILSPQIESWMDVVNPFILKNKIGMVKFIDELCNVDFTDSALVDNPIMDSNNNGLTEDSEAKTSKLSDDRLHEQARDLATVHAICERHHTEIEQIASSHSAAKKLLTIQTILSQHKQYYLNLRRNATQTITSAAQA